MSTIGPHFFRETHTEFQNSLSFKICCPSVALINPLSVKLCLSAEGEVELNLAVNGKLAYLERQTANFESDNYPLHPLCPADYQQLCTFIKTYLCTSKSISLTTVKSPRVVSKVYFKFVVCIFLKINAFVSKPTFKYVVIFEHLKKRTAWLP